ncbi:hypothetical protein QEJ31_03080 [Pigmentibacter sp. JX0631]|uniref:hypothetical protein n=1 Tax=Pigmentibacter sp. JX0631 TaxID=2976982 RepID=UPI0024688C2F|nr:hypothetical protein [Pigmentibacter sp. JX0631]WGL60584.1 hypothetical protein QEJ31_03080 [Pigmentibacter sp. JX0631]
MKLKFPKLFVFFPLLFSNVVYANNITESEITSEELENIKTNCRAKNSSQMEQIRGFGKFNIQSEWLLRYCINNAIEVSIYKKDNLNKQDSEVFVNTFYKIQERLNYLENILDVESQKRLLCYQNLNKSMVLAFNTKDQDFINRAIISYYINTKNDCEKKSYY